MAIVTISHGQVSGGSLFAKRLAERLGYKVLSKGVIEEAAKRFGVSTADLTKGTEAPTSFWDRFTRHESQYFLAVQATLAELVKEDNIVYHGHAGHLFLQGLPQVLKIHLIAPLEYRIQTSMAFRELTREEALQEIAKGDSERSHWAQQFYHVDLNEPALFDLVFNLEHLDLDAAVDLVFDLLQRRGPGDLAEEKQARLDFALAMRVRAELALHSDFQEGSVKVNCRQGVISLSGGTYFDKNAKIIAQFVRGLPGVARVLPDEDGQDDAPLSGYPRVLKAADIMLPLDGYPHARQDTSLREALNIMCASSVKLRDGHLVNPRYLLVLDDGGRLIGIVTRRDLLIGLNPQLQVLEKARGQVATMVPVFELAQAMNFRWSAMFSPTTLNNARQPVRTVMAPIRGAVKLEDDLGVVLTTMARYRFDLVPVTDNEKIVGIIPMAEIFDEVAQFVMEKGARQEPGGAGGNSR